MQDQYKALGEQVQAVQAEHMRAQLATFKRSLEQFALRHRCGSDPERLLAYSGLFSPSLPSWKNLLC